MVKRHHVYKCKKYEYWSDVEESKRIMGLGTAIGSTKSKSFFHKKKESAW